MRPGGKVLGVRVGDRNLVASIPKCATVRAKLAELCAGAQRLVSAPRGDARMGSGLFAVTAFFLGWIGGATASPLIATAGASLTSHREVETVRWRHRHRGYGWGERGAGARDGSAESARAADDDDLSRPPDFI